VRSGQNKGEYTAAGISPASATICDDHRLTLTAVLPGNVLQTTQYTYGDGRVGRSHGNSPSRSQFVYGSCSTAVYSQLCLPCGSAGQFVRGHWRGKRGLTESASKRADGVAGPRCVRLKAAGQTAAVRASRQPIQPWRLLTRKGKKLARRVNPPVSWLKTGVGGALNPHNLGTSPAVRRMDAAVNNVETSLALNESDCRRLRAITPSRMVWLVGSGEDALAPLRGHHVCINCYGKEAIMERSKPNFAVLALLFIIGVGSLFRFSQNLFHFSQNVRIVDVVGLSGGGAACGAAMFGFITRLMARNKA
jgi:hypothetical protein